MGVSAIGCRTCGSNSPLKQAAKTVYSVPSKVVEVFQTVIQEMIIKTGEVTRLVTKTINVMYDQAWTALTDILKKDEIPSPNIALLK